MLFQHEFFVVLRISSSWKWLENHAWCPECFADSIKTWDKGQPNIAFFLHRNPTCLRYWLSPSAGTWLRTALEQPLQVHCHRRRWRGNNSLLGFPHIQSAMIFFPIWRTTKMARPSGSHNGRRPLGDGVWGAWLMWKVWKVWKAEENLVLKPLQNHLWFHIVCDYESFLTRLHLDHSWHSFFGRVSFFSPLAFQQSGRVPWPSRTTMATTTTTAVTTAATALDRPPSAAEFLQIMFHYSCYDWGFLRVFQRFPGNFPGVFLWFSRVVVALIPPFFSKAFWKRKDSFPDLLDIFGFRLWCF